MLTDFVKQIIFYSLMNQEERLMIDSEMVEQCGIITWWMLGIVRKQKALVLKCEQSGIPFMIYEFEGMLIHLKREFFS